MWPSCVSQLCIVKPSKNPAHVLSLALLLSPTPLSHPPPMFGSLVHILQSTKCPSQGPIVKEKKSVFVRGGGRLGRVVCVNWSYQDLEQPAASSSRERAHRESIIGRASSSTTSISSSPHFSTPQPNDMRHSQMTCARQRFFLTTPFGLTPFGTTPPHSP